ncbi:MAG: flagellar hook-associated protein FlgL [Syntrophobacterales bacterium]|nr:flagellar hook-associated protein FlgL [Syntrophobacterales bacterium]
MVTRVTENMKYFLLTNNLSSVQDRCGELMLQLSTLKRINKPSDDPAGMTTVMNYRDMLASMEQYGRNIDGSASWLNITESTLSSVNDILVKIQEMALSQASATATAATREQAAAALQPLIDQILSLANTKLGDSYIFSGTKTGTKPFEAEAAVYAGGPANAARGNAYEGKASVSGTYTGDANITYVLKIVKGGDLDGATYQVSTDGGKKWGEESDVGDLASGTVDLGSGLSIAFTGGTFADGDTFTVDAFALGYYRGNGEEMTLNIGKDHTMHYSFSGEAVFTDKGAGTVDVFGTLNDLKAALAGNDAEGIRATLDGLKEAQQQVTRYQAICGTRTNDLEVTKSNYEALKENITGLMSNVEDADVTKLITDFQMKQIALQASYYMAGEIGKISILNFIK